jgi:hypothetical protein
VSVGNGTSGYSCGVSLSLKVGVAATAAVFLLFGAEVAQAGGIGGIVDDPVGAVEDTLPQAQETDLGEVVDDATEAVDEVAESVDAEAVVSDAKAVVHEVVSDPTGTVENVAEKAKDTVEDATGTVKDIADKTPAGTVVGNITKVLDPVVSNAEHSIGPSEAKVAASGPSAAVPPTSQSAPAASIQAPASPQALSSAAPRAAPTLGQPGSMGSASAPIARSGAPPAQIGWTRPITQIPASASSTPVKVSSAAPAAPVGPPHPGDQPATAASAAGATGAALLAALLSALFFLAPRTGGLARPGPILLRAEPCLSLPERPG